MTRGFAMQNFDNGLLRKGQGTRLYASLEQDSESVQVHCTRPYGKSSKRYA